MYCDDRQNKKISKNNFFSYIYYIYIRYIPNINIIKVIELIHKFMNYYLTIGLDNDKNKVAILYI